MPGATVGAGNAVTDSAAYPTCVAAAAEGKLLVIETGPGTVDTVYVVTPGASGGGGKGNGKGKNK